MQLSLSQTPKSISSANYLLRQYGGAAAAYSLQRLDTSTENVVRARESVGDTEADFTAEEVSGGALREFALQNDADIIRFANQSTAADKRMYFDGSNDRVDTGYKADGTSDFFVEAKFMFLEGGRNNGIFGDAGSERLVQLFVNFSQKIQVNVLTSSGFQTVTSGTTTLITHTVYTVRLVHDVSESEFIVYINGVEEGRGNYTGTWTPANYGNIHVGDFPTGGIPMKGIIYDVNLNDESTYNGYGNTNADWEDQVGSNDGTVNGSPALFSGQGFDAYVTTLYDQSGNGRNATQATAASQPQIVADGVVVTDSNGLETITFDGVDDSLHTASFTVAQPDTIFTKFQSDTNPNEGSIFDGISGRQLFDSTGGAWRIFAGSSVAGGTRDANENLASILFNGASSQAWVNGSSVITGNPSTNSITGGIRLGTNNSAADPLSGSISELIIYPSDQSANRAAIEANVASRYGITLA